MKTVVVAGVMATLVGCAGGGVGHDAGSGGTDMGRDSGSAMDAGSQADSGPDAGPGTDAGPDAGGSDWGSGLDWGVDGGRPDAMLGPDFGYDAGDDAGCVTGTSRACDIACTTGGTAPGREVCIGGDTYGPCERHTELCGNLIDDDGDGEVDEDCRTEGACIWVHASCQGVMTLNAWCASSGGRHLVAGKRCAVAGGAVVPLDTTYGEYPLCCCDVASTCVPECEGGACSSCVVWDEIECCM